jgi:ABC-type antimicrobial peptide transport system permease subunit
VRSLTRWKRLAVELNDREKTDLGVLIIGFLVLIVAVVLVRWG